MSLLKKLLCKSEKDDSFCEEYITNFDTASDAVHYEPCNRRSRRKSKQSSKSNKRRRSKGRHMQIPKIIHEQIDVVEEPQMDGMSESDLVVLAVRKELLNRPKQRSMSGFTNDDIDTISTTSSLTTENYGTLVRQYYGYEPDQVESGGPSMVPSSAPSVALQTYQSVPDDDDDNNESECYLDQCIRMVADIVVNEEAPHDEKQKSRRQRITAEMAYDDYTPEATNIEGSQNTYTEESSRGSYSSGQSSYEDSMTSAEFVHNVLCDAR